LGGGPGRGSVCPGISDSLAKSGRGSKISARLRPARRLTRTVRTDTR